MKIPAKGWSAEPAQACRQVASVHGSRSAASTVRAMAESTTPRSMDSGSTTSEAGHRARPPTRPRQPASPGLLCSPPVRPSHWIISAAVLGATVLAVAMLGACGGGDDPSGPACDPARGPRFARFADVTADGGVDFQYSAPGFQGGGLAVSDLDGDGLPELVAGRRHGGLALYRNLGGLRFAPLADAGLDPAAAASAIAAADLDNDGDRDLVLAGPGVARVMANLGDGTFTEAARLDGSGLTEHVLPVDLDGDGLLDLHFSNYDVRGTANTQNRLYLNRGGLAFAAASVPGAGLSWTATALDADGDGDQDLYVANDTLIADHGQPRPAPTPAWPVDLLLRNDGPGPRRRPALHRRRRGGRPRDPAQLDGRRPRRPRR